MTYLINRSLVISIAVVLVAGVLPAQTTTQPATFLGLDLTGVPITPSSQEIPELSEPMSGPPPAKRSVVTFQIEDQAMFYYLPLKARFYLRYPLAQGRGGAQQTQFYGPFEGDPFQMMKIDELYASRLAGDGSDLRHVSNYALGIRRLLVSGDMGLALRGLRMIDQFIDSNLPMSSKDSHLAAFLATLGETSDAIRAFGLNDDLTRTNRKIDALREQIADLTTEIPADQYAPAAQGKTPVPAEIPAQNWSAPVDGLRTAAVLSATTFPMNQSIDVFLVLENVSDRDIRFSTNSGIVQDVAAQVKRPDGTTVNASRAFFTGMSSIVRYVLKPGERLVLAKPSVSFVNRTSNPASSFGGSRVIAPEGDYTVAYTFNFGMGSRWERVNGVSMRTSPGKGEWRGTLTTGAVAVRVTAP